MPVVRFPTLYGLIAARIRVDNQDDADSIVAPLHKQTTLTALSDWKGGPDKLAMPPAPLNRPVYTDEFAYFRRAAELMTECPPMAADAAAVEIMKRIGMEAGKPFDPDALDANVRAGVLRAAQDIPAMTDAIRLTRGIETPNRWRTNPGGGDYGIDYITRAEMALVGLMGNDKEEAVYLQTFTDRDGNLLNGAHKYILHLDAVQLPRVGNLGCWSLTMYNAYKFQFADYPINRYKIGSADPLHYNPDGSRDILIQAEAPEGKAVNWLPSPAGADFKMTVRMYLPVARARLYRGTVNLPRCP